MPIIFENRLGNHASDKKLRSIYRVHNILWTLYYAIIFAVLGFGIAIYLAVESSPIIGLIIALVTISLIVLFVRGRTYQRKRR